MPERPVHELINELSLTLAQLSDKVVLNFLDALHTVKYRYSEEVKQIILIDDEIKMAESNLEERCLAFLAMHQPVARDLRAIVSTIKINDDLKHIGALAVHIIDNIPEISSEMLESFEFENIGMHAGEMVTKSIDAFVSRDSMLARHVSAMDETIDAMHRKVFKRVTTLMKDPDSDIDQLMAALSISRYIERMADHAARIASEVVFLVTGEIIRHAAWSYEHLITSSSD